MWKYNDVYCAMGDTMSRPKIFISSTVRDFKYLRLALKYNLEKLNFDVLLSELPDFDSSSVEPKCSPDVCFENISHCQYFILLIGGRIGDYYDKSKKISITRKEYEKAYELSLSGKIKIFPYVEKDISTLKKFCGDKTFSLTDDQKKMIDDPPAVIFDFIDFVSKTYETDEAKKQGGPFPLNNWRNGFTGFDDLMKSLVKNLTSIKNTELDELFRERLALSLRNHSTKGFGWGENLTVLRAPKTTWWETKDVIISCETLEDYTVSQLCTYDLAVSSSSYGRAQLEKDYNDFRNDFLKQNFDGDKFMLINRPVAFSDSPKVILKLQKTKWSMLQFFWHKMMDENKRKEYINDFFDKETINFPNSFCLHLIVMTSDNKILITENIPTKNDKQGWSITLGEQIAYKDIENGSEDCAAKWVERAMKEELHILPSTEGGDYDLTDVRFLAVNLEADLPNFAICCIVKLLINHVELKNRLCKHSRIDYEFSRIDFLDLDDDDVPKQMLEPSRIYHPSSMIRMAYAYIYCRGIDDLSLNIHNLHKNKTAHF